MVCIVETFIAMKMELKTATGNITVSSMDAATLMGMGKAEKLQWIQTGQENTMESAMLLVTVTANRGAYGRQNS